MLIQCQPDLILTEVYVVDFGDNYHKVSTDPTSELERLARRIRRRYRNIYDYTKAISVYNEYMELLIIKYGGHQLFDIKLKYDLIEDFVPPKPRMRNTFTNKFILKNKIVLSNIHSTEPMDSIKNFINETMPFDNSNVTVVVAKDRIATQLMKEESSILSTKRIKDMSDIDHLEEYFRTKNIIKEKKESDDDNVSLKDILSGKYLNNVVDTSDKDAVVWYQGRYMNQDSINELQVYQQLNETGWNSMRLMKQKNVSNRITRVISDNERKAKKKNKKHKKTDDFIIKISTDNDYETFRDFENDMRDFTSGNVFNR